ncbi:hypothetical protein BVRB_024020, partial [Beta vulgaris subsp. vulgaris]
KFEQVQASMKDNARAFQDLKKHVSNANHRNKAIVKENQRLNTELDARTLELAAVKAQFEKFLRRNQSDKNVAEPGTRLVRSSPIILARCRHAVVSFSSQPVQESWRAPASTARDPKLAYYFYTLAGQVRHQMDESDTQDIIENYIRRNRTKIVDGLRSKYNEIVKFVNDSIILPPSCILDNEVVLYSSNVDPRIDKDNEARI